MKEKYIKPLTTQHITPINEILREIRKHITKEQYWIFDGKRYGPMTKKNLLKTYLKQA